MFVEDHEEDTGSDHHVTIPDTMEGMRCDKALIALIGETLSLSRTRLQQAMAQGYVQCCLPGMLPGYPAEDASAPVQAGAVYRLTLPPVAPMHLVPDASIPLDIIYEDDALLVVNKQAGLTVHPGAGQPHATLVHALLAHTQGGLSSVGEEAMRPGIVHRLDRETSGLLLVAKTDQAHLDLSKQLALRTIRRTYLGVNWGVFSPHHGTMQGNITRDRHHRQRMMVVAEGGKTATTHYRVTRLLGGRLACCVEYQLETGRTHQIRVHSLAHGCPIVGDKIYTSRAIQRIIPAAWQEITQHWPRHALHARHLAFIHPTHHTPMAFEAPIPSALMDLIAQLERGR